MKEDGFTKSWKKGATNRRVVDSLNMEAARRAVEHIKTLKKDDGTPWFPIKNEKGLIGQIYINLRNGRYKPDWVK